MIYRYDLSPADLGVSRDSFVGKYLEEGQKSQALASLSEQEQKNVSTWIKILFNPDSIADELLSTCRPQDFYLLVPTIFSQIIFAQSAQAIQPSALHTPFECLYHLARMNDMI
jgi:mediator of RNA polymerase II transcription subunit 5